MKRILSAAVAAAALMAVTGCDGGTEPPTQVSTSDPSAGITSNYTSQSLQAEIVTTTSGKTTEPAVTETSSAETETYTVVTSSQAGIVSQETSSSAVQNPVKTTTTASRISSGGGQAAETTTSSAAVQNPVQTATTTVTSSVSQTQEPTSRPVPTHEEIISAYKAEVSKIIDSMSKLTTPFGRMEHIALGDKGVEIILVKNPAGFNEVISFLTAHCTADDDILFGLNDNSADGTDVSWIWDVEFEKLSERIAEIDGKEQTFFFTGKRGEDLEVRLKYAGFDTERFKLDKDYRTLIQTIKGTGRHTYMVLSYTVMLAFRDKLGEVVELKKYAR